jgi:hypothetical protein
VDRRHFEVAIMSAVSDAKSDLEYANFIYFLLGMEVLVCFIPGLPAIFSLWIAGITARFKTKGSGGRAFRGIIGSFFRFIPLASIFIALAHVCLTISWLRKIEATAEERN